MKFLPASLLLALVFLSPQARADVKFDLADCAHYNDGEVRLRCFDALTKRLAVDDWKNGTVTGVGLLEAKGRELRVRADGVGGACDLVVTLLRGDLKIAERRVKVEGWPVINTFAGLAPQTPYTVLARGQDKRTSCFGAAEGAFSTGSFQ